MHSLKQTVVLALLLVSSTVAGFIAYRVSLPAPVDLAGVPTQADVGALAQITLPTPDGNEMTLDHWNGQPQIVNFWATWCGPCREEMPVLVQAQEEHADKGLVVIGLSMDFPEDTQLVQEFAEQYNVQFPLLMAADHGNTIAASYGAENFVLPISVFVAADGTVTNIHTGLLTQEQAERELAKIL